MKNGKIKKVLSHIKEDSKEFKKQLSDDVKLRKELTATAKKKKKSKEAAHEMKESKKYEKMEDRKERKK